ncbi:zinc finger, CCHC-type containing protein, partial [Tanacetum coccineum]
MSILSLRPCMCASAALLGCSSGGDVYPFQAYDTKLITTEQLSVPLKCYTLDYLSDLSDFISIFREVLTLVQVFITPKHIKLPVGNNVVPLQSDTIRLVQNGCTFHGLRSEDPNQHLKDFLKLVDSLDLYGENRERTRLRLFQLSLRDQASNWLERLPAGSITTWEDLTTRFLAQFFPPRRTAKLFPHHGLDLWLQIQIFYDHVDGTTQKGIDYVAGARLRKLRPDEACVAIKRLAQYEDEGWNDAFIPYEVILNYENPDIEQLLGIMERKVDTLMKDAISFMGKSDSVFRLTTNEMYRPPYEPSRQEEFEHIVMNFIFDQEERIRQLENYMQVITEEFMEFSSKVARRLKERIKENDNKPRKIEKITKYPDTKVLENSAKHNFLENLEKKTFPTPVNFLYEPLHKGVTFRLGGKEREMSLHKFGWKVNLYTKRESKDVVTLSGLRRAETVNFTHLTYLFWPSIGDNRFNVGNTKAKSIRDPRIKLAHQCIMMTITGRKKTTNHVAEIDLFYLYCIHREGVVCNIPYWLAKYLKGVRDKSVIFGGCLKKSLVKMGVIMELHEGECCWLATKGVIEEDKGDDEEGDGEGGNEGVRGSADIYRNMSAGDLQ